LLDGLLDAQVYRLAFWRVAGEEINYRRFFDINELAAIRMEEPEVFAAAHRLLFRLVRDGIVTGLRIDHPDGLYRPAEYFPRVLRARPSFSEIVYESKRLIMDSSMASELNMLAYRLNRISEKHRSSRDFTLGSLRRALREIIAAFPVYRTYLGDDEGTEAGPAGTEAGPVGKAPSPQASERDRESIARA